MPEPEKRTIDIIVAKPGKREGKGGKDSSAPPKGEEVGGRYARWTWVVCPHCGSHRHIVEETEYAQWYTCGNCGMDYYY